MLSGSVIHGDGFGRQLGYPTANIVPTKAAKYFRPGIYAAMVTLGGEKYQSALAIHDKYSKIEVFDAPAVLFVDILDPESDLFSSHVLLLVFTIVSFGHLSIHFPL